MGALHFGLDPVLLKARRQHLPLRIFVETGTYEARTTIAVAPLFDRGCTVELSRALYERAAQRLAHLAHVEVIHGSSPQVLRNRRAEFNTSSVLYWLDAHWCRGNTGGIANECPLLGELAGIGKLNDMSVVLIDDARYFLAPPPAPHDATHWPGLLDVQGVLRRMSTQHKVWIVNDVIIFAPNQIADDMPQEEGAHTILCNADILVSDDLKRLCVRLDPGAVYLAHRVEVELNAANPELLDTKSIYGSGFDLFLLPPEFVRFVCTSRVFPPEFRVGEPWWDWLLPVVALAGGFPLKRLPLNEALALHHSHPVRYDLEIWSKLGEAFLTTVASLAAKIAPRACDLLDDLAALSGPLQMRLDAASLMIRSRLP